MATWTFSGYNTGRGAAVTFTYTAAFDPATNKTRVTITNYTAAFNTGGASGYCALTGTLTVKAADNTGSAGTLDVSASKNGNSPTVSADVSQVIEVAHGKGTSKQIILAFSGTINALTYFTYPNESTTVTVASATARSLSISVGEGASVTVNRTSSPWAATGALTGGTVYDGDVLTISFSVSTGYSLSTHTVNGSSFTNGGTHTVSGNVTIVATATRISYTLTLTADGHCALTVERSGEALSDGATIYHGDVLTITFAAASGYKLKTATLNGEAITSPASHTVDSAVAIIIVTSALGFVYRDNGTEVVACEVYRDNGTEIVRCRFYRDNGAEIVPC